MTRWRDRRFRHKRGSDTWGTIDRPVTGWDAWEAGEGWIRMLGWMETCGRVDEQRRVEVKLSGARAWGRPELGAPHSPAVVLPTLSSQARRRHRG
jgi:hypothetical protein